MTYTIALNFEDGVTRFIDCKANEKVLDAAYRNRINLYLDFGVGVEAGEHVRVNIGFAVGLLNMSATKGYKVTRNALTIGAAYLF